MTWGVMRRDMRGWGFALWDNLWYVGHCELRQHQSCVSHYSGWSLFHASVATLFYVVLFQSVMPA